MFSRIPAPAAVVLVLLSLPMAVRGLDDPPKRIHFFTSPEGARRARVVDTSLDYPPPVPTVRDGGLAGGGLAGAGLRGGGPWITRDEFMSKHAHPESKNRGWRRRTIMRVRRGEESYFGRPDGLDGYECDLERIRNPASAESKGIRVWDSKSFPDYDKFIPPSGRVADAPRGLRFTPKDRPDDFSWLWTTALPVDGWMGKILDVERVPGGLRVRVEIRPEGTGRRLLAQVDYVETYLLHDEGRLEHLGGDGRPEYRGRCVIGAIV